MFVAANRKSTTEIQHGAAMAVFPITPIPSSRLKNQATLQVAMTHGTDFLWSAFYSIIVMLARIRDFIYPSCLLFKSINCYVWPGYISVVAYSV